MVKYGGVEGGEKRWFLYARFGGAVEIVRLRSPPHRHRQHVNTKPRHSAHWARASSLTRRLERVGPGRANLPLGVTVGEGGGSSFLCGRGYTNLCGASFREPHSYRLLVKVCLLTQSIISIVQSEHLLVQETLTVSSISIYTSPPCFSITGPTQSFPRPCLLFVVLSEQRPLCSVLAVLMLSAEHILALMRQLRV